MYKGMKWYKCDLQMQTPGDYLNWLKSDNAYLKKSHTTEELINSVDLYLKKCYDEELEIIAITDHNFIGKSYLEKLIERNSIIAKQYNRNKIIIFPGFEVEINEGKGVHLLCIFNPDKSLNDIDGIVSSLGLIESQRIKEQSIVPINKNFSEVNAIISKNEGIIIAAHPMSESGFLNDKFLTEHFQKEMYIDKNLLAMEIPKPLKELSNGWQDLLTISKDCAKEWRRKNQIATIMSSDCYSLDNNQKGFIGKRFTWIKLHEKNINGLRQAFHENELRISHDKENPNNVTFPHIQSIEIRNVKFLANQQIHFSPNFNCLIGGRGTGKSTLIEYIRLCLNYKNTLIEENVDRAKNTLSETSSMNIIVQQNNQINKLEYVYAEDKAMVVRDEKIYDANYIFESLGIQILGQKEISKLAQNQETLIELIDYNNESVISIINEKINNLLNEINKEELRYDRLIELDDEINTNRQKVIEIRNEISRYSELNEIRKHIIEEQSKIDILKKLYEESKDIFTDFQKQIHQLESKNLDLVKNKLSNNIFETVNNNIMELNKNVNNAFEEYINKLSILSNDDEIVDIRENLITKKNMYDELIKDINLDENEIQNLREKEGRLRSLEIQTEKFEEEKKSLNDSLNLMVNHYNDLYQLWNEQYQSRESYLNDLISNDLIPKVKKKNKPFITFNIEEMRDEKSFQLIWEGIDIPRNTRLGRNWSEVGGIIFDYYLEKRDIFTTPWLVLHWIKYSKTNPIDKLELYYEQLKQHLWSKIDVKKLMKKRINDFIDVSLLRTDGSVAGTIQNNGLSDGQKNTVILMLLLAKGDKPIIIDQPEDELDSDFIYNQLVPMLRKIKMKRQIIISSHNANLPVNGDAEYIHALFVDNGSGEVRANGGIDNKDVKMAVLDIMEGSEEAFEKRKNKYYS